MSSLLAHVSILATRPSRITGPERWNVRFRAAREVRFGVAVRGSMWVTTGGQEPTLVQQGDCFVAVSEDSFTLGTDPTLAPSDGLAAGVVEDVGVARLPAGDLTCVEGGQVIMDDASWRMLRAVLPEVTVLARGSDESEGVAAALTRFFHEARSPRVGAALAASRLGELVCLAAVRACVEAQQERSSGWLAALVDPDIGESVRALYADLGRRWTVGELAAMAHLTPSAYARKFREVVGQSPSVFLLDLRMRAAAHRLRTTRQTVAAMALDLGYASESWFSRAFTRSIGMSPGRWRRSEPALHTPARTRDDTTIRRD